MKTTPTGLRTVPLETGDRLTRAEFEERYSGMAHVKKAELIEGVVYMPSPVRFTTHGQPHGYIMGWLAVYCAATPFVTFGDNTTVRLDIDNEPQPDALLRLAEEAGGASLVDEDGYIAGPPELIIEVAGSSAAYDLFDKKNAFRRNGVREYLVWQTYSERVDWFVLLEGRYVLLPADDEGVLKSPTFPGLWLNARALLESDLATVLFTLQTGLQEEAHQNFVETLQARANNV